MTGKLALMTLATALAAAPVMAQETGGEDAAPLVVSPALKDANTHELFGRVWQGEQLSLHDRSLATVAALIARGQNEGLSDYMSFALDHGVTAAEISETIYHLAYYAGWQNAMDASAIAADAFAARGITQDELPLADPQNMLPLDEEGEARRAGAVQNTYGSISQGTVDDTTNLLFRDLWLRPALAPRDRSLVTVAALVAAGHSGQIGFHLGRAMDNGLTKDEASALLHHLAFYAGWPNVFSAMPVAGEVFARREGD